MFINQNSIASLHKIYNAAFQKAFAKAELQWDKVATEVPSAGESNLYAFLGNFPKMREWLGDRVVKNLKTSAYNVPNKTFEATIGVPKEKIEDDTYGIYAPMFEFMGDSAARHPDEIIFALMAAGASTLCYDGQYFFDTDHPVIVDGAATTGSNYDATGGGNLWALLDTKRPLKPFLFQKRKAVEFASVNKPTDEHVFMTKDFLFGAEARSAAAFGLWQMAYGSLNTLNSTNVNAYIATMRARKSDEGQPLHISPDLCVVGPSNEAAATELFLTPTLSGGGANPLFNRCKVLVNPYLT